MKETRILPSLEIRSLKVEWLKLILSVFATFFSYFFAILFIIIQVSVQDATTNTPSSITTMWVELTGLTLLWSFIGIGVCAYFIREMTVIKTEEMVVKL